MEMNEADKLEYKKILLQTTKDFIKFCEENGLMYYASDGTALGAVRHKGLIPWDDDVDVLMPHKDYERFLQLQYKLEGTDYEVLTDTKPNYPLLFAKFSCKKTTIWEVRNIPCIYGAFVDVVPMYEVDDTDDMEKKFNQYRKAHERFVISRKIYSFSDWFDLLKKRQLLTFFKKMAKKMFYNIFSWYYHCEYKKLEHIFQSSEGSKYIGISGLSSYFRRPMYEKEWFGRGLMVPFEDFMIRLPENYDAYLKHLYGDYMTLPPIEQRISHHYLYFYDLKCKLTVKECKDRMKKMNPDLLVEKDCSWYNFDKVNQ
jgi:lipopolysaccharide cholinephosphotransferase